ncbi:MAG TPA: hypothetical protein VL202_19425 [Pararhizobium sp.]|uniref:hypothetical protein n=1 Tax=Pararhizobium sp. TaxID=1977563 RepID=UPI002BECCE4D|nr:hypothetical protein [Pararhizobium sp.]HTO33323.1 hypothetical protein [Pararhizobium sp.]
MTSEDIQNVIALMERHGIAAFDYEHGDTALHLTLGGNSNGNVPETQQTAQTTEPDVLRSPGVGTLLFTHPATGATAPVLPRRVAAGDVVSYIRTGLTLRAVVAKKDCLLLRAWAEDGAGVGYDDALFEIAP